MLTFLALTAIHYLKINYTFKYIFDCCKDLFLYKTQFLKKYLRTTVLEYFQQKKIFYTAFEEFDTIKAKKLWIFLEFSLTFWNLTSINPSPTAIY